MDTKNQNKKLQLSGLLLLGLGLTGLQAQTMYVRQGNDTQTVYDLTKVRKMTFSGGNINVFNDDNSTGQFSISELRYLRYVQLSTYFDIHPNKTAKNELASYPNPVINQFNVDLSGEVGAGVITILTLEGKLLLTQDVGENRLVTIELGHLPKGVYLCQYHNAIRIISLKIVKL